MSENAALERDQKLPQEKKSDSMLEVLNTQGLMWSSTANKIRFKKSYPVNQFPYVVVGFHKL